MRHAMQKRRARPLGRTQHKPVHPAVVGGVAGVASATVVGIFTYYSAKLAARMAGPLAVANGVLVGGAIGYLAGSYWNERSH